MFIKVFVYLNVFTSFWNYSCRPNVGPPKYRQPTLKWDSRNRVFSQWFNVCPTLCALRQTLGQRNNYLQYNFVPTWSWHLRLDKIKALCKIRQMHCLKYMAYNHFSRSISLDFIVLSFLENKLMILNVNTRLLPR